MNQNNPQEKLLTTNDLLEKYQDLIPEVEEFLQRIYQKDGFEPIEMAILLHIISGQQLNQALHEYVNLTPERIQEVGLEETHDINEYIKNKPFINQVIGSHRLAGMTLMKFDLFMKDVQNMMNKGEIADVKEEN